MPRASKRVRGEGQGGFQVAGRPLVLSQGQIDLGQVAVHRGLVAPLGYGLAEKLDRTLQVSGEAGSVGLGYQAIRFGQAFLAFSEQGLKIVHYGSSLGGSG